MMTRFGQKKAGVFALLALVAASCSQESEESTQLAPDSGMQPEQYDTEAVKTIPTTDELGSFETPVSGIALWQHPSVPFESLVLAANGSAGLFAINFEQEGVASFAGDFSSGMNLSYIPDTEGSAAIIVAEDATDGEIKFLKMSVDPAEFSIWSYVAPGIERVNGTPLCLAKSAAEEALILFYRDGLGIKRAAITLNQAGELDIAATDVPDLQNIVQCTSDDRNGTVYLLDGSGTIFTANAFADLDENTFSSFATLPSADVVEIAIILQETGGYLLTMLSSGAYEIYAYELESGQQVGTFVLGEFSDIAAVETISAFTADASNLGGLYREGAIAIVEGEGTYALKLAPWTAVRNILGLPQSERLNRRSIGVSGDGSTIDGEELLLNLPVSITEPDVR